MACVTGVTWSSQWCFDRRLCTICSPSPAPTSPFLHYHLDMPAFCTFVRLVTWSLSQQQGALENSNSKLCKLCPPTPQLSRQAQTFPKNTCWKLCVCVCLKPSHRTLRVIYSWFRVTSHSSAKVLRWYIFFKSAMKYLSLDNDVTWEYWPRELGTFVTGLKRRHQYTRTLGSLFVVRFRVVILNSWKILSGQLKPSCILELDL